MEKNLYLPSSKHFQLKELTNGVYAAIYIEGGAGIGNAGIIDLGDRTLIFDTFASPQAAEDLRGAAESLTGRPIDAVINSHWHHDHLWGNQVFSTSTDIIASEITCRMLSIAKERGIYDDSYFADAASNLEIVQGQLQAAKQDDKRRQLTLWIDYYRSIVETQLVLENRIPNLTFAEKLTFHGTDRIAKLIALDGHSESDSILYLPQDRIAFMGDLLGVGYHPYLKGGNPTKFFDSLVVVSDLSPKVLVPGHGPIGMEDNLAIIMEYIQMLDRIATKMIEYGEEEKIINSLVIPEQYKDWLFASFYFDNLHFLYNLQIEEIGSE